MGEHIGHWIVGQVGVVGQLEALSTGEQVGTDGHGRQLGQSGGITGGVPQVGHGSHVGQVIGEGDTGGGQGNEVGQLRGGAFGQGGQVGHDRRVGRGEYVGQETGG